WVPDRPNASPRAIKLESARTPRNCAHHAGDAMDSSCHGSRPSRPSSPTVTPLGVHVVIQSVALHLRTVASTWRHLDLGRWRLQIRADLARLACPTHGVLTQGVPFARAGSRFTRDFE